MWNVKLAIALADLGRFPRGTLPQNMFRSAFWNCRLNGLGRNPRIPATIEAAQEVALRVVRQYYPDFTPDYACSWAGKTGDR